MRSAGVTVAHDACRVTPVWYIYARSGRLRVIISFLQSKAISTLAVNDTYLELQAI